MRSLIILATIGLALLAYLVFFGLDDPGTVEIRERSALVLKLDRDQVDRIEHTRNGQTVILSKTPLGIWEMEKPVVFPSDKDLIDRILASFEMERRITSLDSDRIESQPDSPASMGLVDPRIDLKLRAGKTSYRVSLGSETPRSGQYYARVRAGNKNEWLVVGSSIFRSLDIEAEAWMSKKLFNFSSTEALSILIRHQEREMELVKESGEWMISRPFKGQTEPQSAISYLGSLLSAKASGIQFGQTLDPAKHGLNNPFAVIDIKVGEKNHSLRIGNRFGEGDQAQHYVLLSDDKTLAVVPAQFVDEVVDVIARTRQKSIFNIQSQDIRTLRVSSSGKTLDFSQTENFWNVHYDGASLPADKESINHFFRTLHEMKADEFSVKSDENRKKLGLTKPFLEVQLFPRSNGENTSPEPKRILISSPNKGYCYVDSDYIDFIVRIPSSQVPPIAMSGEKWLEKRISLPKSTEWESIAWLVNDHRLELKKNEKGEWQGEWQGRLLDQDFFNQQMAILDKLQILQRARVSDSDFKNSPLSLEINAAGSIHRLRFSLPKDRELFLMENGQPNGYIIHERDLSALQIFPLQNSP